MEAKQAQWQRGEQAGYIAWHSTAQRPFSAQRGRAIHHAARRPHMPCCAMPGGLQADALLLKAAARAARGLAVAVRGVLDVPPDICCVSGERT